MDMQEVRLGRQSMVDINRQLHLLSRILVNKRLIALLDLQN